MVGNAHLDPVWLWPWQEGYQEARATFSSVLDRMDEYPDFVFTCDQVVLLSWVEESSPELFARIRQRVAEGRWVNVGGWWVEPDCNIPMGESFVRQGLLGQRYLQRAFGRRATVGMNVDPFGHTAQIPQVLRGQGMASYCFMRPGPHEADLPTAFWWAAPDGSRVLAYQVPFSYDSGGGDVFPHTRRAIGHLDRASREVMVFYGVGNHGGGPTRANIDSIHRYDVMGTFGSMTLASPVEFLRDFAAARSPEETAGLPVVSGDLQNHAPGSYSAQSMVKKEQRRAQHAVLTAERWAAVSRVLGHLDRAAHPGADLRRAWEQVLFTQFHDTLPGTAIASSYVDARDQLGEAVSIAKRVTTRAHNAIAQRVAVPAEQGTHPVVVFNPHPWPVRAVVEMQHLGDLRGAHVVDEVGRAVACQPVLPVAATPGHGGSALVFAAEVDPLGHRLYRIRPGRGEGSADERPVVAEGLTLVNEHVRVTVDPGTGWLSALTDAATGTDVVAGAAGEHLVVTEDPTDTWGHGVVSYAGPGAPMGLVSVAAEESGPLRASVRVVHAWNRSRVVEVFSLAAGSRSVRVDVTVDWRERSHLLKWRVPVRVAEPTATFEVPFAHVVREVDGREQPGQSWVDLTGTTVAGPTGTCPAGLTVVNDAKHGYDVSPEAGDGPGGASLGITAVRSPVYSWHDPTVLVDPERYTHQDQGVQTFSVLLLPHGQHWSPAAMARAAAELGQRQRAMMESAHPGDLPARAGHLRVSAPGVLVSAVKVAEDGTDDLVVRAVERDGRAQAGVVVDVPALGVSVTRDFAAFQIRTVRVALASGAVQDVDLLEEPLGAGAPAHR